MLPIGVLLPTRNSMALLPRHIESMRNWLDVVEEVVVVDSESTDGTAEELRKELAGRKVRFFDHPRGLYQSWNFGIRQIRAPYTYVSTVGDAMTREGLEHLAEVAQRFECDVVISKPNFVDERDCTVAPHDWPIEKIISALRITEPACLHGWTVFLFAFVYCPDAVLGSSASNLYRTACLQEHPFPTDYGTVGDGAWGLANAPQIRMGVTPRRVSFFREHAKSYAVSEYAVVELPRRLHQLGMSTLHEMLDRSPSLRREAEELDVEALVHAVEAGHRWQGELIRQRRRRWPWILNPVAWNARVQRDRVEKEADRLLQNALAHLQATGPAEYLGKRG